MNHEKITLPPLPYAYDALEPVMSAETLKFHHDKHLATYVDKFNAAVEANPELAGMDLTALLRSKDSLSIPAIRNNGGGVYNHVFFFDGMAAPKSSTMSQEMQEELCRNFGSVGEFKEAFQTVALNLFGSGWAWLVEDKGALKIVTTANQDTPLEAGLKPLLNLDVWEHAYYLDYQNRRVDYISGFFDCINWPLVSARR